MFVEAVECPAFEFYDRGFYVKDEAKLRQISQSSAEFVVVRTVENSNGEKSFAKSCDKRRETVEDKARTRLSESVCALSGSLTSIAGGQANRNRSLEILDMVAEESAQQIHDNPNLFLKLTRLKTKDQGTFTHSVAVAALMERVALVSSYTPACARQLSKAGLLHDIGKLRIPERILNSPGKLSDSDMLHVKKHTIYGKRILLDLQCDGVTQSICLSHHELLDGSGYPNGISGLNIDDNVRISTVCDVFEALTSVRSYKSAWPIDQALRWMSDRPHLFDLRYVIRLGSFVA